MCCHYSPEEQEGDLGNQNNFLLLATPDVGVDGEKVLHASLLKVNESYTGTTRATNSLDLIVAVMNPFVFQVS